MDAKLDAEMAPEELNTIEIASNVNVDARDVENGIEKASAKSETHISPDENEKGIDKADIDATRLFFGVKLPILEENIQLPGRMSKIQKVPALLRQNPNFDRYCSPKMISFGPIHHREQNGDLQLGQQLKYIWAFRYMKLCIRDGQDIEVAKRLLCGNVTRHLQELRNLFSKDVTEGYNDEELVQMLFVDGCALLYFMNNIDNKNPGLLMLKFDQLWCVWSDIILLENQLPEKLLNLLLADPGTLRLVLDILPKKKKHDAQRDNEVPTHLLDYIRYSYYCYEGSRRSRLPESEYWHRYKNIGDLRKAGIQVKVSETDDISFTSNLFRGRLMLPRIVIHDITRSLYHNLIAYEMCPDFHDHKFEFCSYFSLMDSFIDDADDVKELRAAGVLQNLLGSDEEVAKFFNELGHVLTSKHLNDYTYDNRYVEVKCQIDQHYRNKWKTWLAQLRSTYFNNPWSYIAFFAAVFALVLSFLQTWYTIHPKN